MARALNRLSAVSTKKNTPGLYADGGGLYLRIASPTAKRWVFVFRQGKKRTEIGLGSVHAVSLSSARERAQEARDLLARGKSPLDIPRRGRPAQAAETFGAIMDEVVKTKTPKWRNRLSLHQWKRSAEVELAPLRHLDPAAIDTAAVLEVLKPVWNATPETGRRLRGRLEHFLDAAKAKGARTGENPARWRGHLSHFLSQQEKLSRGHHAAVPFDQAKTFFGKLAKSDSVSAQALALTILTACRSGEVMGSKVEEFDLESGVWIIPATRMKGGKEHRVALSTWALETANTRIEAVGTGYLFPGLKHGKPLCNLAMPKVMKLLGYGDFTVHGWRATFRTWAGERTNFPLELAEMALAHLIGDETMRAYSRGDALDRRRQLMEAWAEHCAPKSATVVRIA